ncbi:xylose isomerase-like protein [Aspergillus pseudoustus]|uniref:Xylose isomerase-like protein n=1 Tax=Aspergillus pseudoustus TaxID=1810923 RepID=A0ABR4JKE9_9EURO
MSSSKSIPLSYATCSIGTPDTPLPQKLTLLSQAGFTGIELAFPDLLSHASSLYNRDISPSDYGSLTSAAKDIRSLAIKNGLAILMLQPFSNFEGWPRGSSEHEDAFKRAKGWCAIMDAAGIEILQVGSTDTPLGKLSPKERLRADIVQDLRELCDILSSTSPKMRVAYENWCWSSHAQGWKEVWEIAKEVDRPNIGLCLDTFQSAGGEWADPSTASGLIGNVSLGSPGEKKLTSRFEASMAELASTVPPEKLYLLQVSDAYRPSTGPLSSEVVDGTATRGRWSHDFRPMPYDGGYLPIETVGTAVLKTGFRGWFSMEIFDGGEDGKGREGVDLKEFAWKARESMGRFIERCLKEI